MAKDTRTFTRGRMNKELDERLIPNGEYIDALNIRVGSTEEDDMGVVQSSLGNTQLTNIQVQGVSLSNDALCIGALEDPANETLYWFVHDPAFTGSSNTSKLDLILSFNTNNSVTTYHVISMDDGGGVNSTLNFNPTYLITGVNIVDNLLFFTDDYNPPRRINVTKSYGEPTALDVDTITAKELLVIKEPPNQAPKVVTSYNSNITSTFLEERYICFAYRWRYDDNEYSATSQFTLPAFEPDNFNFTAESYLNEGMVNKHNTAQVTFKTGGPLVKGIDLLFKEANNSTIKVIEKFDKEELGFGDDNEIAFNFSDSKIFTILPESEILRLYDNVPKLSQSQTIMGNRLMYGNYEEGYDLIDKNGNPTLLNYVSSLQSATPESEELDPSNIDFSTAYNYLLPTSVATGVAQSVNNAVVDFDITSIVTDSQGNSRLKAGAVFEFTFTLETDPANYQIVPAASTAPAQTLTNTTISLELILAQDYDSVADWINSTAFQNAIGTAANIKPVYDAVNPTSCSGTTFTDAVNCGVDQTLGSFSIYTSGYTAATSVTAPEPILATSQAGDVVRFIFPGFRYVNNVTTPTVDYFAFFKVTDAFCQYVSADNGLRSLHSNRGYEIGIIYMDEFSRSTTALVSTSNAVHVPCANSDLKNYIRVDIPTTQLAPSWATRYKFAIKPDREGYNTIYSNIFEIDTVTNKAYILLQGENARKVEEGDRLIVKTDTSGPLDICQYVTVLEKGVYDSGDLPGSDAITGAYMVLDSSGLTLEQPENALIETSQIYADALTFMDIASESEYPYVFLPFNLPVNQAGCTGTDYTIPAGSVINIYIRFARFGSDSAAVGCESRECEIDQEYTASQDYDNLVDWFIGDGIAQTFNNPEFVTIGGVNSPQNTAQVIFPPSGNAWGSTYSCPSLFGNSNMTSADITDLGIPGAAQGEWRLCLISYPGGRDYLGMQGSRSCGSSQNKRSRCWAKLEVRRAGDITVFETLPQDASPDLFFESAESYAIDTTTGYHLGNVQNQTSTLPAIIDTDFFNCFSFGNGVESYKVRDSVEGKDFSLGNRATTTAGQDYKEIRRYADLTYSGVYNQESNVNKLNEFNLGLLNFKPLEQSFGPIQKLFARETDVLVLQEDKISYVLAGKNLLSDAVGGGTVASIPEVLGTQIARIEEFGISQNPESFADYGPDKYFTDAKRGAVIQLRGTAGQNEALMVISNQNMSTWFRDLFQVSFDYQKLGGYDPYADEYVLSSTLRTLPTEEVVIPCGTTQTYVVDGAPIVFTINVGSISEDFNVVTTVLSGTPTAEISYDSVSYPVTVPGTTVIPKPNSKPSTAVVTLGGVGSIQITVECPEGELLNIIQVCLTSTSDGNALIHNEFNFAQGTYSSPTQSTQVQFSTGSLNPVISQWETFTGFQGQGYFPSDGSTVEVISNKYGDDTYVYDSDDDLRYLRTNTSYPQTATAVNSLLAASTALATSGSSPVVSGTFSMPATGTNLYLIYDYRDRNSSIGLCYSATKGDLACCCVATTTYYMNGATLATSTAIYTNGTLTTAAADGFYSDGNIVREQTGSPSAPQLGPAVGCKGCILDCGTTTVEGQSEGDGLYNATFDTTATTGAIIIKYTPNAVPNGIRATFDGTSYNKLSSAVYGKLQSSVPSTNFTICGTTASECAGIAATHTYPELTANNASTNPVLYTNDSTTASVTLAAGDIQTTLNTPGMCVMVIPKPSATPIAVLIENVVPCKGASWELDVVCAAAIPATLTTAVLVDSATACPAPQGTSHYIVKTDGTTGGAPALHAYVFTDANGATAAANGWIAHIGATYQIQDGIIVAVVNPCP